MTTIRCLEKFSAAKNDAIVIFIPEEKELHKRREKDKKADAIKRAKEVLKYSTLGAVTGGSLAFIMTFTIAELMALGVYREGICNFDYSNKPNYMCKAVSCSRGMPELKCFTATPKTRLNKNLLLQKGFEAGRQAHSEWWDYTGETLLMFVTSGSILVGGILGGVYGFFKKIPTAEETAAEEERERRRIAAYPYTIEFSPCVIS